MVAPSKPHRLHKAMLLKWTLSSSEQSVSASNTSKYILKLSDWKALFRQMCSHHCFLAIDIVVYRSSLYCSTESIPEWLNIYKIDQRIHHPSSMLTQDHNHSASDRVFLLVLPHFKVKSSSEACSRDMEEATFWTASILCLTFLFNMTVAA